MKTVNESEGTYFLLMVTVIRDSFFFIRISGSNPGGKEI